MTIYAYSFANKKRDLSDILSTVVKDEPRFISNFKTMQEGTAQKHEWLEDQIEGRSVTATAVSGNQVTAAAGETAGLDFSQMDSSTLGADRIANAAALLKNGKLPASNFDCGTAITLETVLENGVFAGGAIMPGRKLMRTALNSGTAALPELPLNLPLPEALGKNTVQAMTLGIDLGAVGMVRELMKRSRELNVKYMAASGGDAEFFCKHISELEPAGKLFTLQGIHFIAVKHLEKE